MNTFKLQGEVIVQTTISKINGEKFYLSLNGVKFCQGSKEYVETWEKQLISGKRNLNKRFTAILLGYDRVQQYGFYKTQK